MKRLLLITAGDFTHTGGIERYNTILFNILKKYYVNYSIDAILTGYDTSNEVNQNVKVVYSRKVNVKKNKLVYFISLFIDVFKIRSFFEKHQSEYDLILDASRIGFPSAHNLNNYYLIQHFDVFRFYLGESNNKFNISIFFTRLIRKILRNSNFLKLTKHIIVFDKKTKEVIETKYPKMNVIVISLPSFIPSVSITTINNGEKREKIIFLGRLSRQKNIPVLIKLNESLNLIDFYGKADGKDGENYRKILVDNGWYKGIINGSQELIKKLSNYKFMLLYSLYEGFPFSLVEALSQGLPIIVKDTFLSAQYLCNEKTGLLLPKNTSIDEDISLMRKFLKISQKDYLKLQLNCVNFYNQNLSIQNFTNKWLTIFDKYLERK